MKEYLQYLKDRHDSYVDQRKNLDALAFQMGTQHDKWVLTLSGGALGLSVTFLEKIVSHPEPWTKSFLFCSWSAFAFSLLAAFYSIHFSHLAINRQLVVLDEEYSRFRATTSEEMAEGTELTAHQKRNKFIRTTQRWSRAARISTVAGIALFCLFCFSNIRSSLITSDAPSKSEVIISTNPDLFKLLQTNKENAMPDPIHPQKVDKSYVPPTNQIVVPAPKPKTESYVPPTNTIPPPAPKKGQ